MTNALANSVTSVTEQECGNHVLLRNCAPLIAAPSDERERRIWLLNARGPGPAAPPQAEGAHPVVGDVQVLAEQIHDLQAGFAMLVQEAQQVFAPDCRYLSIVQQFRGNLMRTACEGGTQSQDLTGPRDTKDHTSARFRRNREFRPAVTQNKNAAGWLSFPKQRRSPRAGNHAFQRIEGLRSLRGKITEQAFRTFYRSRPALLDYALHASLIIHWREENSDCNHR